MTNEERDICNFKIEKPEFTSCEIADVFGITKCEVNLIIRQWGASIAMTMQAIKEHDRSFVRLIDGGKKTG